jgi:hypothetical protein
VGGCSESTRGRGAERFEMMESGMLFADMRTSGQRRFNISPGTVMATPLSRRSLDALPRHASA